MTAERPYGYIVSYATSKGTVGFIQLVRKNPWNETTVHDVRRTIAGDVGVTSEKVVITSVFAFDASA